MPTAASPLFFVFDAASSEPAAAVHGLQRLQARLQGAGREHGVFMVQQPAELHAAVGRAINAAREARGAVVAVGGQAIANALLQAAWNAQLPMGVLAAGATAPSRARSLDHERALGALLNAQARTMPLGLVADRVFLRHAHIGLHLPLPCLDATAPAPRRWAALRADLGLLLRGRSLMTLELRAQGELRVVRTRCLQVGVQAPPPDLGTPPVADPARLLAFTREASSAPATVVQLLRASLGGWVDDGEADGFAFDQLELPAPRRPASVQVVVDGELLQLPAPLVFQPAPRPLLWLGGAGCSGSLT